MPVVFEGGIPDLHQSPEIVESVENCRRASFGVDLSFASAVYENRNHIAGGIRMLQIFGNAAFALCAALITIAPASAQQTPTQIPDAPTPSTARSMNLTYTPPTQSERFKSYVRQTYGIMSFLEAGMHAGIAQARDNPSGWPQGAEGYGDRFGSAYGEIVIRGTTEYVLADLFREDVRRVRCNSCGESRFKIAFDNTFLAKRGDDGHEAFSVSRIVSPFAGSAVAVNTWYPSGSTRGNIAKEAGVQFGLRYIRNLIR